MAGMREIAQASAFKCTIVSFVPFDIREPKPGLNPGEFFVPKAPSKDVPSVLIVSEGTYGIYLDGDRGTLRARTSSHEVARSIFEDYISSQLAVDENSRPALFAVPGAVSAEDVLNKYPEECEEALRVQKNWFLRLVRMGDDSWNRYHQHGVITDLMRYAATALDLHTKKEWMIAPTADVKQETRCPACGNIPPVPTAVICSACGCVLNQEAYEKLQFAGKPSGLKNSLAKVGAPA